MPWQRGLAHEVNMPETIPDPLEPLNRGVFIFNSKLMQWILNPLEKGYKWIAPESVRGRIANVGENLAFPVRFVNNLLQGKISGASSEAGRFVTNSTVGILGLFDPASKWGMYPHEEDFGQTFGSYGSGPGFYLTLPVMGPSSGRDAIGKIGDSLLNPASYVPGANAAFRFNELSFSIDTYLQQLIVNYDPYVLSRDIWAIRRRVEVTDFEVYETNGKPVPTLEAIFFRLRDRAFPSKRDDRAVFIPATGRKLPYSIWLQPTPQPLILILPGAGNHRFSETALAVAEMVYSAGYSVVVVSSTMNHEFMKNAATVAVPGFPLADAADLCRALRAICADVRFRDAGKITKAGILGISLGALHTLFIAAAEADARTPCFSQYLALNAPVDLTYAQKALDGYYNAPLTWSPEVRKQRIIMTLLKAGRVFGRSIAPKKATLPFSDIESRYLIGLYFRWGLRDVLYLSERQSGMNLLLHEPVSWNRAQVYEEIYKYSYTDYFESFVIPYFSQHPDYQLTPQEIAEAASLRSIEDKLAVADSVKVVTNANDFLLGPNDVEWYKRAFGKRLLLFQEGGHLGNLHKKEVQSQIVEALSQLKQE